MITAPETLVNAFIGKPAEPTEDEVAAALGPVKAHWDDLLARLASECGITEREWNSYSPKKAGWALRLKVKKRNIVYLGPSDHAFRVSFILGDRAVEAVRQSKLPKKIVKLVEDGKRYPEGTGVLMAVTSAADLPAIVKLAAIKMQH